MTSFDPGEVEQILRSCALRSRETFDLWLHRHLNHRLLAWVAASKCAGKLCLKGSALLDVFQVGLHRPVRCVDFLALEPVRPDELRQALGDIHAEDRGDGVSFDMGSLVRFARSYRSVYLERGHGAIAAAFLGMDFCTVPPGLLHYISIPESRLTAWQSDVDSYLGLDWTEPTREAC